MQLNKWKSVTLLAPVLLFFGVGHARASVALVQREGIDVASATSATLAFNSNNTAGNWIAVCIRAGRSGEAFTVTDSRGNTYHQAVQLNDTLDTPNGNTIAIFYAENISAGANTVTVAGTILATLRRAILEAFKPGSGRGQAASILSLKPGSGAVGAAVTVTGANFGTTQGTSTIKFNGTTATPTSWSATSIVVPVPSGATTGNVVVTVSGAASNGVTFTVVPPPSITSLNPTSGVVGASVTVTGANFGATQGSGTITFNGTA